MDSEPPEISSPITTRTRRKNTKVHGMTLYLTNDALDWSLQHHKRFGDTDLFPTAFEFEVADERWVELRKQLAARDLVTHKWRRGRTLLVMKDKVSFRRATQFDPIDSILSRR